MNSRRTFRRAAPLFGISAAMFCFVSGCFLDDNSNPPPPFVELTHELTGPTAVVAGECSEAYKIGLKTNGSDTNVFPADLPFLLSGMGSGLFYSDATCATEVQIITVKEGEISGEFYFKDTKAETLDIAAIPATSSAVTVSTTVSPAAVAKIVFIAPETAIKSTDVEITVQAQDEFGNLVPTFAGEVDLVATGSVTGEGKVTLASGAGTIIIRDAAAETATLSLADTYSTGLDVSMTQTIVFAAAP